MSDPFAAKNPTKKDPPSTSSSGKPDEAASNADAKVAAATTTNETLNEDDTPVGEPPFKKFKIPRERRSGKIAELEIKEVFDSSKPRKYSKHDQKWEDMYKELVKYKEEHNSMLVPQCYKPNRKLGRWVHYQRVEYWTYQQTKNAKINPYRITKLNDVGFIWDPQNYTWNQHYEKLVEFVSKHGNCRVPKGYKEDPELANWVRFWSLFCYCYILTHFIFRSATSVWNFNKRTSA